MPARIRLPRFALALIFLALFAFSSRADGVDAQPNAACPGGVITQWTFFGDVTTPSTGAGVYTRGTGLNTETYVIRNPDKALSLSGWNVSSIIVPDDYVEFAVDTTGRSDITIGFDYYSTTQGPTNLDLQYSTDGSSFTSFSDTTLTRDAHFYTLFYNLSAIAGINNNPNAKFRLYGYINPAPGGGNLRLDNVTISESCPTPTPSPTPIKIPGLTISNAVNNPNPLVGANILFTIKVENPVGNLLDANNVNVAAALPVGLTYISNAATQGSYDPATGVWSVGNIPVGSSAELALTAKVINSAPSVFAAVATSDEYLDVSASQTFAPTPLSGSAELALTQTFAIRTDAPSQVDVTVLLINNGLDSATNVKVRDLLPSGLTYVSHSQSNGSYDRTSGIWTLNSLANGATATLKLTVKVAASGTSTKNTAQIIASDQYDTDLSNNLFALEVPIADVSLTQWLDQTPTTAIFTVTATNSGPDPVTLKIQSNLPTLSSYVFVSAGASSGTYDPASGIWDLTLANATSATLTLTTNLVGALQSHVVEVVSSDAPDPDSIPNNHVRAEDDMSGLPYADLSLTQTASKTNPSVGENVALTIKVKNSGASNVGGVQVKTQLPSGLAYVASSATHGSYNAASGIWNVGSLANGATATLTLTVNVSVGGAFVVQSEISAANLYDPDSTPNNGEGDEDDIAKTTLTTPSALRSVIINEVAWAGTSSALSDDEWIELYNPTNFAVNITGWTLKAADGTPSITLSGSIPAHGFFLLEQGDDHTVSDIAADQIYSGTMSNSGESLVLRDGANAIIDTANGNGGMWPAGSASTYGTMERVGVTAESDVVWRTNTGVIKNGKNANGGDIWGTPKRANSANLLPTPTGTPYKGPTLTPTAAIPPRPIFNEILARPGFDWNQDGDLDAFDEFIEIKNLTAIEISLTNWKIKTLKGGVFTFANVNLAPGERKVFYGKETNLRLSDGGETLTLVSPQGKIYDTFSYSFARTENQSFCRLPDGSPADNAWREDCIPTPNLSNTREGKAPVAPAPAADVCNLPDSIPLDFFLADCRAYGAGIWNPRHWLQPLPRWLVSQTSKWDSFIE
ncbi:MAG: DUF11 domain-containing protein [Anaerolineales bacterium]|nr:DUF11 domain-containing protein [Anaerolineales bacterium]